MAAAQQRKSNRSRSVPLAMVEPIDIAHLVSEQRERLCKAPNAPLSLSLDFVVDDVANARPLVQRHFGSPVRAVTRPFAPTCARR
jgi:hypothetical protein